MHGPEAGFVRGGKANNTALTAGGQVVRTLIYTALQTDAFSKPISVSFAARAVNPVRVLAERPAITRCVLLCEDPFFSAFVRGCKCKRVVLAQRRLAVAALAWLTTFSYMKGDAASNHPPSFHLSGRRAS